MTKSDQVTAFRNASEGGMVVRIRKYCCHGPINVLCDLSFVDDHWNISVFEGVCPSAVANQVIVHGTIARTIEEAVQKMAEYLRQLY